MFFKINTSNGTPVYEQVVNQVVSAIATGSLETGDMIPSVRQLSQKLTINPNTVARAYRNLQELGIVDPIRGSGLRVVKGAQKKCANRRNKSIKTQLANVIATARQGEMTDDEILEIVHQQLKSNRR